MSEQTRNQINVGWSLVKSTLVSAIAINVPAAIILATQVGPF